MIARLQSLLDPGHLKNGFLHCAHIAGLRVCASTAQKNGARGTNVKCADKIQLHALQEVLDVFQESDEVGSMAVSTPLEDQLFVTLSVAALTGHSTAKTLCLAGEIQGIPVSKLVDSGSSHTFLCAALGNQ
ncbi:putative gag-pol polyprotein [Panicum miliaceum]|uniref:Gag-pol polyprotein n=1 Tax=Panicum miliaceum TaxID=4540 RepID=A0A3L6SQR6_PANMI|nr:putative gag-pol polyprotein [Panicum miliaceum]